MRITGGIYGGRTLEAPKDRAIRPTSDKVRQAIFNMLNARGLVEGAAILDAFCGTGALGIEALSRGALCCTFMDKNGGSLDLCRRNFAALKIDAKHYFALKDAVKPGEAPPPHSPAGLVFLDPPYCQSLVEASIPMLQKNGWILPAATFVIESEKGWDASVVRLCGLNVEMSRDYGDTTVTLASALS